MLRPITLALCLLLMILAACAPAVAPTPTPIAPTDSPAITSTTEEAPGAAVERPTWQTIELVNAHTGETFTLADFDGKTVYVEPMATWCTNCRAQMKQVIPVFEQLDSNEYVFVSLSVAENVSDETLAAYADEQGYGWIFAITPPTMLAALTEQFGRAVTTPPSTPHFVIAPDGTFSDLITGSESTDALLTRLTG